MPYKDPVKQKKAQHESYLRNKKEIRKRNLRDKAKKRTYVANLKNTPCMDCGNSFPSCAMDLDHRESEKKLQIVSVLCNSSWIRLLEEIKKCDIVCSNCHRIRTYKRYHKII